MKFCAQLLNDINFEPAALQPCCNVWDLKALPRFSFSGGKVDLGAYARHIMASVRAMQVGELCAGCPDLTDISLPAGGAWDVEIKFKTVSMNQHRTLCNCRCVYCKLWEKRQQHCYSILPPIQSLAAQQALREDCIFSWGGGESSILKEFEEASLWILSRGYHQYIHTNALRCSPAIERLLREGMGTVNVSLDSGSAETYRVVKGVPGFDKVRSTLQRYAQSARDPDAIHLKYIMFRENSSPREVMAFFTLCGELGVGNVQLSLDFHEVNAKTVSDATLEAAALFVSMAQKQGIQCSEFSMDGAYRQKILALAGLLPEAYKLK